STTTRDGYREYKSNPAVCQSCPLLSVCTQSKNHQKVITRHLWKDDLEVCEDIRHQRGMKERYQQRKETIERLFGTAKEYHNLRYTRLRGKSKMEATLGLTLACLNMKKYSKIMAGIVFLVCLKVIISRPIVITIVKEKTSWINIPVCLQSELLLTVAFLINYLLFNSSIERIFWVGFFLSVVTIASATITTLVGKTFCTTIPKKGK
ncbi:transposase, partial [Streptococcus agalactiae]|uniref:transposase n=1 Tax=Streptococcus agalactiae TaxID=1311 RepID=UPI001E3D6379